eukprot:c24539_g1_i1 orf=533-718(+)
MRQNFICHVRCPPFQKNRAQAIGSIEPWHPGRESVVIPAALSPLGDTCWQLFSFDMGRHPI